MVVRARESGGVQTTWESTGLFQWRQTFSSLAIGQTLFSFIKRRKASSQTAVQKQVCPCFKGWKHQKYWNRKWKIQASEECTGKSVGTQNHSDSSHATSSLDRATVVAGLCKSQTIQKIASSEESNFQNCRETSQVLSPAMNG